MKIMKNFLVLLMLVAYATTANAQSSHNWFKNTPAAVNIFMQNNHPDVSNINMAALPGECYVVEFQDGEKECMYKINNEGTIIDKEKEIMVHELPENVIKNAQILGKIKYAWKIEKQQGETLYLVELRKMFKTKDLIFDEAGNTVNSEADLALLF